MPDVHGFLLQAAAFQNLRVFPARICFVIESDRYKCLFDVGFQTRVKRAATLEGFYSAPAWNSTNLKEQHSAREAKRLVMDVFRNLDGLALLERVGERYVLREVLFEGSTSYAAARTTEGPWPRCVEMGRYLEVMRAYDFDRSKSDFVPRSSD